MIILAIIRAIIIFLSMIVWMIGYGIGRIFIPHTPASAFAFRRHWLKYCGLPIMNIKVSVEGEIPSTPAIFLANHRSFSDPIVICRYLNAYVIAKAEVANYPIINKGAEITGVLYVKREDKSSRNSVRDKMIETIKDGYNILVFPEGTVGIQEHTLDFRPGTFFEAAENNVPIVPMAIEFRSEKDLWVIPNFVKLFLVQFSKWKTEVKLSIGPVMMNDDGEKLRSDAQKWVNKKLLEMHHNWTLVDYTIHADKDPMYKYKN